MRSGNDLFPLRATLPYRAPQCMGRVCRAIITEKRVWICAGDHGDPAGPGMSGSGRRPRLSSLARYKTIVEIRLAMRAAMAGRRTTTKLSTASALTAPTGLARTTDFTIFVGEDRSGLRRLRASMRSAINAMTEIEARRPVTENAAMTGPYRSSTVRNIAASPKARAMIPVSPLVISKANRIPITGATAWRRPGPCPMQRRRP